MFGEKFCLQDCYPADDEKISRYIDFAKLAHLLCTKTLYLTRGDQFTDQYEGIETKLSRNIRKIVHGNDAYKENSRLYERNRRSVAINCWYIGENESNDMWKTYANGTDGVLVQSNVSKLKESFTDSQENICISKVVYIENHNDAFTKFGCPFFPFLIKRKKDFSFENELRVIFGYGKYCKQEPTLYHAPEIRTNGIELPIDPTALIERIIISSKAPAWLFSTVERVGDAL